jgi:cell division protein FtsW (lipid II flippase)
VEKKKKGEKENEREGRKSASAPQDERGRKNAQFFWEVAVFLLGIFIGFFWSQYAQHTQSQEGHLVVALLIVVLILIRYISLFIGR